MRIVTRPGIIFIHIPKNAGCSIARALDEIGGKETYPTHSTGREIRVLIGNQAWENAVKFAVVRHPYENRASQWTEMCKLGPLAPKLRAWKPDFQSWIYWLGSAQPNPWDTAEIYPYESLTNRPQSYYVTDEDGKIIVGNILKYENIKEEFKAFCKKYHLRIEGLPLINFSFNKREAGGGEDYLSWYTQEMKDIIYRVYREDFERFGYLP